MPAKSDGFFEVQSGKAGKQQKIQVIIITLSLNDYTTSVQVE